jgi:hypothetical protein
MAFFFGIILRKGNKFNGDGSGEGDTKSTEETQSPQRYYLSISVFKT